MINVAVCDDETSIIRTIKKCLSDYQLLHNCEFKTQTFICGEDLIKSSALFDLIFLDIEMNGINGIQTARLLRQKSRKVKIIYVTSHSEYALSAYEIHPFDFIKKPVCEDRMINVLDEFMLYFNDRSNEIQIAEFKGIQGSLVLKLKDIYVFEYTGNRRITVYTEDKEYVIKGGIKEIFGQITSDHFTSPHKSFIINMEHVKSLNDCILYMTNNIEVPVAQKKLKEFQRSLSCFIENYIKQE